MKTFFNRLTFVSLILAIAMTLLSAYIRLADTGLDCEPWPGCISSSFRMDMEPGITISKEDPNKGLRATHRFMASVFGILAVFMLILAWRYRAIIPVRITPTLVFVLTLILTFVGMQTPDIAHPIVMLTNLTGGMGLSALLLWQLLQLKQKTLPDAFSVLFLTACFLAIASGAWVSANFAAGACPSPLTCVSSVSPEAFNPFRELHLENGELQITEAQPLILAGHYLAAGLLVLIAVTHTIIRFRRGKKIALSPLVLIFLLTLFGLVEHLVRGAPAAAFHNFLALTMLLAIIRDAHASQASTQV